MIDPLPKMAGKRLLLPAVSLLTALPLSAAALALDWSIIGAGGGSSTGETYTISGTIGQLVTSRMESGTYMILGGFWTCMSPSPAVNIPDLVFQFIDGQWCISWDPNVSGCRLEQSEDPSFAEWTLAPPGNPVVVPTGSTVLFYRLCKSR